ncbi:MAG TPA: amidohydrolase family protein [Solirubrobacteraceae bacterium]|nr:amidohydrolase family protein [Solirubrobacteraceae bacterium]
MGWVDVHHHILPPRFVAEQRDEILYFARDPAVLDWTRERALEQLDRFGIDTAYVSLGVPGAGEPPLARACNEYSADLKRDYPGRFGVFASLPLPDVDASLSEVEYAFDQLGADGIGLLSNYSGRHLGDPLFAPLLEELDRRRAVVHVHPIAPPSCRGALPGYPDPFLEFPFDTTRTVTSLLYAGAFTRWPRILFIFSHGGGAVPMLSQRIVALAHMTGSVDDPLGQLSRLRTDAVTTASRPAFAAATELFGHDHILFGSDYPYVPIAATAHGLRSLGLSADTLEAIGGGNAAALLGGRPDGR